MRYIIKQSSVAVHVIFANESYAVVQILFCYNFYLSLPFTAIMNNEAQKRGITLCTKDKICSNISTIVRKRVLVEMIV